MLNWRNQEELRKNAFGLIALLILPIAIFSSKAMAPLFVLLALVLMTLNFSEKDRKFSLPKLPVLAFLFLLLWAAASLLWTFDQSLSGKLLLPLTALFGLGIFALSQSKIVSSSAREMTEKLLIWGAAITIALLLFESVTGSWLTRFGRALPWYEVINFQSGGINIEAFLRNGVVILAILQWPIMSALVRRRHHLGAALLFLLTIYLVFRFSSATAIIAIIGSIIGIGIARYRRKFASIFVASMFVFLLVGAPFIVHQFTANKSVQEIGQFSYDLNLPNSGTNRLLIWRFATQRIFEKPLFGWGMNTARQIPGGDNKYTLRVDTPAGKNIILFRDFYLPLHPHNAALQIWLELGAVGAIIVAIFGWLFIRKLADNNTDIALLGVVISILAFNFLSFGAWQSWWIATQFLCLCLTLVTSRRNV
tara:strand:+ start:1893 stop:3158 length:1266 start_codon:yes stop_codon:yes gene_type:complete